MCGFWAYFGPIKRHITLRQLLPAPYHCTHLSEKRKLSLKKFSEICVLIFFSRTKFYIKDFFIWNEFFIFVSGFSFPKHNNYFSGFFFLCYFSIPDFFIQNRILIFVSRFLFPELNNHFRIYFSEIYFFNSRFLFPELRTFLEIEKNMLGAG